MLTSRCPICRSDVIIEDELCKGDLIDCINCGVELEIISLNPLRISILKNEDDDVANIEDLEK
ncbi:MAG: lysine biosynthesis protein LysW [Patescibacteria group bacterium]